MVEFKLKEKYIFPFDSSDKSVLISEENFHVHKENKEIDLYKTDKQDIKKTSTNSLDDVGKIEEKKTHAKRNIIIGIVIFLIIGGIVSNFSQSSIHTQPEKISTTEEEMNYRETISLKELRPLSKDEGDAFFYEDNVIDAYGNTMNSVVHPGSTGTVKSTGGGGAHPAQGFNRIYQNDGYATFTGELFISEKYSTYTQHTLTLYFEVYGDGQLLYEAPHWRTGNSYNKLPFEIDISNYNEIRIHFEAINDKNLFSWEDCAFGISKPIFSKLSIGEQMQ